MNNGDDSDAHETSDFSRNVGAKETRKLKAQRQPTHAIWFGFAMFGLVGWSVAIPTLLGAALGWWLDRHHPAARSWTLTLLIAGLILGCINAWHWVSKENQAMHKEQGSNHD